MLQINNTLSLDDFHKVLFENTEIKPTSKTLKRIDASFKFLKEFSKNKVIYGVNTGFGPMAQYKIKDKDRIQLQYNLIRSHASGSGKAMEPLYVKALMLARLNTLSLGKSGVHRSVAEVMQQLINKDITPLIFEHGGVGASGDLVQLAHLALVLIGEGEVFYKDKRRDTSEVFSEENISPIKIEIREGLALMNGTSAMTGIGIVNIIYAKRLLNWSVFCSAAINEIVQAYDDHLSEELNAAKKHQGQQKIAEKMRDHLKDSKLTRDRNEHLYNDAADKNTYFKEKVQEYYSLRCVPQILGPVYDTIEHTAKILIEEVNSANDNPIIDVENKHVYHGGNFHGDYVALEMDKLKLVVTKLSMLAERQLNYLLNNKLNDILPPFVNLGKLGLNFGMQGAQFTAVSTTAENQTLSNPMYIHSIPNNNDNQDIVSMGTNAANITKTVIDNAFEVISIELITIVQALRYLNFDDKLSNKTRQVLEEMNKIIPEIKEDSPLYKTNAEVKEYLKNNEVYK
ncbi:HAL/PAL/TAL family ammonia-lyase [Salegentibacter mishustinae]|uniref:Histidine ammonia-lyase n=1 Tax=Salegentibacter mishustinae TaxID=270918 RepID=A0A0Q9Z333_9FLAO|nr:aromatic amino acid ammonia-lyase [Salegentibacter mishustinae]KRG27221.1 histidine ammonia-lyase [Salegentibacter mishustinae]PNW21455.1 histidine ammonia-lyase [Salegentibacter mishustinae]PZX62596.1 histidine ammonia-lyase [Salegentibacter mishustinae]GGW96960.1 histidine ammonia-lyase [Salegentibacter mishustinae]